jgi:hypothetical protein
VDQQALVAPALHAHRLGRLVPVRQQRPEAPEVLLDLAGLSAPTHPSRQWHLAALPDPAALVLLEDQPDLQALKGRRDRVALQVPEAPVQARHMLPVRVRPLSRRWLGTDA